MKLRRATKIRPLAICALVAAAMCASFFLKAAAQNGAQPATRPRQTETAAQPSPTPPKKEDDITLNSDDVVRVETNLTNIFFTASDKQKHFVSTLAKEDVRLLEDGVPQQIFTFQPNSDLPLSMAVLIDCSGSEERTLPEEKAAARAFLEAVLRADKDEAAIVSFTGEVTLEQGLTGNIGRLRRANVVLGGTPPISGTQQTLAGSTAIWDAIWATSNELLSGAAEHTRRAIILLTDGVDTISQVRMQEAINRALKADALIYAIGIGDRYQFGIDDGALKKVTENTGGRAFFPRNERELNEAFAQIQRDLRERYLIAYSSSNKMRDGSYRRITIEITNPEVRKENLKLNYRPGYFAKTPVPESSPSNKKP